MSNRTRFAFLFPAALLLLSLTGCQTLVQKFNEMNNFAKCVFRLESVTDVRLLGLGLVGKRGISDFNLMDVARLQAALSGGSLPLDLTLNLEVRNPNPSTASMSAMEWILLLDDNELTRGQMDQELRVPPNNGVGRLPLRLTLDLKKVLSGKGLDSMVNLGLNIAGEGKNPSRVTMKVKPSVTVAGQMLRYPGYIKVQHEFGVQ